MDNKIVFLVSGGGGTLRFIHKAILELKINLSIVCVIADRVCEAYNYSRHSDIPTYMISYSKSKPTELIKLLQKFSPDLIVTNIHKVIDKETLGAFKDKFINLHYSLLPSYAGYIGMETVNLARQDNVKFIGGTCHEVNEYVDAGKIISQGLYMVNWEEDIKNVYNHVFRLSSMCLLNGILVRLNLGQTYEDNNQEYHFNPQLRFRTNFLKESFWESVK